MNTIIWHYNPKLFVMYVLMSHICQQLYNNIMFSLSEKLSDIYVMYLSIYLMDSTYHMDRTDSPETIFEEIIEQTSMVCKYHDLENVEDIWVEKNHKYCALHLNIYSLPAKPDQLKDIVSILSEKEFVTKRLLG